MRLLLDESLPRGFADLLVGHEVATVQGLGWSGTRNGELLQRAAESGFDAMITPDRGFEFQQNLFRLPLTLLLLKARGTQIKDLEPLVAETLSRLKESSPCEFIVVGA